MTEPQGWQPIEREPSGGMILANSEAGWPDDAQTIADWQAMIDAALSE